MGRHHVNFVWVLSVRRVVGSVCRESSSGILERGDLRPVMRPWGAFSTLSLSASCQEGERLMDVILMSLLLAREGNHQVCIAIHCYETHGTGMRMAFVPIAFRYVHDEFQKELAPWNEEFTAQNNAPPACNTVHFPYSGLLFESVLPSG